jgi:hypothetical protein
VILGDLRPALHRPWWRARRFPGIRTLKTVGAAVAAYAVALHVSGQRPPVLAPLTALLVVQLTLYETVTSGARRIVAVVAGVLVAVGFSAAVGFRWWSLGLLIGAALVVGKLLRLGEQLLEVPISAMLVLAVNGTADAAGDRIYETLIGAAVGVVVNAILAPPLYVQSAGSAVGDLADSVAGILTGAGDSLRDDWSPDVARRWLQAAQQLDREVVQTDRVLGDAERSLRLNPRGRRAKNAPPSLRSAATALEHAAVACRGLLRTLLDRSEGTAADSPYDDRSRAAIADALVSAGEVAAAFGRFAAPNVTGATPDDRELLSALDRAGERRGRLPERLAADPHADQDGWRLHGALLASLDRVLSELDPRSGGPAGSVPRTELPRRRPDAPVREMVAAGRRRRPLAGHRSRQRSAPDDATGGD